MLREFSTLTLVRIDQFTIKAHLIDAMMPFFKTGGNTELIFDCVPQTGGYGEKSSFHTVGDFNNDLFICINDIVHD